MRIADSSAFPGALPVAWIALTFGPLCQSSFVAITLESDWRTSVSVGFGNGVEMPNGTSDGPVAVINTFCGPVPCTITPAIITLLPVWTIPRVEMLISGTSGWSISNAPTTLTPEEPAAYCTIAMYAPGGSVTYRPAS